MARDPASTTQIEESAEEKRLKRWMCTVEDMETERIVGTGILIGENLVLTSAHVAPGLQNWPPAAKSMENFSFKFDHFKNKDNEWMPSVTAFACEKRPLYAAKWADSDLKSNAPDPEPHELDYAIIELKPLSGGETNVGREMLEDDSERGWLKLEDAGEIDLSLEVKLLGTPNNSALRIAEAGKIRRVEYAQNRIHYDNASEAGISGGLAYSLKQGKPIPLALHAGRAKLVEDARSGQNEPAVHGILLSAILEHARRDGFSFSETGQSKIERLKIEIITDFSELKSEKKTEFVNDLTQLFTDGTVTEAFKSRRFSTVTRGANSRPLGECRLADITNLADGMDVGVLDGAAKADLVFVFVTADNCIASQQRDRLIAAYSYLTARLGQQRVFLVYPHNTGQAAELTGSYIGGRESVIRYEETLLEIAENFTEIARTTRVEKEDERGFFELAQVALKGVKDRDLFDPPHFDAHQTLDMLGLRFGSLARQLPTIIDEFLDQNENRQITIAFPGLKVWEENRGWLRQLQGGGSDTIHFLKEMQSFSEKAYEVSVLKRVRLVAINEIPTFILTAADIHSTWGRMLIAPAFSHRVDSTPDDRVKPRLVVHNKLSNAGVFNAYRAALIDLVPFCREGAAYEDGFSEIERWSLDTCDGLDNYITRLTEVRDQVMKGDPT